MSTQTTCLMSSCSFSSVCDVYDGGIVHSLNNPYASLTASNTSFIGCCRTRNVVCEGTKTNKLAPGRQNITENGANSFTWCKWSGSRTTGKSDSVSDWISSGGAIFMYSQSSASVSVSHCVFNGCVAYSRGGGIMCVSMKEVKIENNIFNTCTAKNFYGGGLFVYSISTCVRISRCEFRNCSAYGWGGGLYLENFNVSGSRCIPTENEGGKSACVFDCSYTSCSLTGSSGGGMYCNNVPVAFKVRSIQFISCSAASHGGDLRLHPNRPTAPDDGIYCYFLFFHECKCSANTPRGHDIAYADYYIVFLSTGDPFYECYTTNTDDKRVCYGYNYANSSAWTYRHTEKKDWLKDKMIYVSVSENDLYELCGSNESNPCLTVKKAFEMCEVQISLSVTLMEGNHKSGATTIEIGTKKISVIGRGKEKSSIGAGALLSAGALFSVSTGHLGMSHLKVDCNSNASPSPRNNVMSSSVFVVPLSQLSMVDVEIKDMNVSEPLFSDPDLSSSFSSSLLPSLSPFSIFLRRLPPHLLPPLPSSLLSLTEKENSLCVTPLSFGLSFTPDGSCRVSGVGMPSAVQLGLTIPSPSKVRWPALSRIVSFICK
ncbi:uncharacterized protein MONOS_10811 [Monocercomonoides exilis]|uniref:uncharacterized protein n=1 Tax=Monocercomonoides exilis TaxID=2049356 RepID=UPI0035595EFE|nr:hypothetical protein MONOS_10811 [Monocercomonoides exilis]|eukprot:MONOS_10811.1-p1 / transcript=MONOS_10811.1 / gene=MONOS_10811 / organism=Monocercomonoides_exilis_PA203 / gene_product=unspecified product / transcript_product=unspecified product / location=Mono_scaffold00506:35872-37799(+) / protein_length=599 / sequence_SO=supercontig / SO=protein_coding / is_pseudo=false